MKTFLSKRGWRRALWMLPLVLGCVSGVARAGEWQAVATEYDGVTTRHEDARNLPPHSAAAVDEVVPWDERHGLAYYNTGDAFPEGSGGYSENKGRVRTVFQWVRSKIYSPNPTGYGYIEEPDPKDNPPDFLLLKVVMWAGGSAYSGEYSGGYYASSAMPRDPDKESVTLQVLDKTAHGEDDGAQTSATLTVTKIWKWPTQGAERVEGPWCGANAKANVAGERWVKPYPDYYPDYNVPVRGMTRAYATYNPQRGNFVISASVYRGHDRVIRADHREVDAFLKQDYRLNEVDQALVPFWSGQGTYSVAATNQQGNDFLTAQHYEWILGEQGAPYIPAPYTQSDAERFLPAGSRPQKEFYLDFGPTLPPYGVRSTVKAIVTGAETGSEAGDGIVGDVIVNWHPPQWYVYKAPATVTTVTGANDPDTPEGPINPEDRPDDPAYAAMQNIKAYTQARKEFIQTGATYIKNALEVEKSIAEFYATGPLYELGGAALEGVLTKAGELLEKVNELRAFAGKSREAAAEARRLAQEGKQLGKSAEDIAQQEALAVEAEEAAVKAEQEATAAEQKAVQTAQEVKAAQELPGNFSSNDFALGTHENIPGFQGNAPSGKDLTDNPTGNLMDAIKNAIDGTVTKGGKIRFNLDPPFKVEDALNPSSVNYNSYTSQELRYVLEHYPGNTVFYEGGQIVAAPR